MARKKRRNRKFLPLFIRNRPWRSAFYGVVVLLGLWVSFSDNAQQNIHHAFVGMSADAGFVVDDILIEGRIHTDKNLLVTLVNIQKGDPLFAVDTHGLQRILERISWVEEARVERRWPNVIYVRIQEHMPFALYQNDGKTVLIDSEGTVITSENLGKFADLIVVSGDGADAQAADFMTLLAAEADFVREVRAAHFISQRRWDIHLKNGMIAKLPENNAEFALRRLADAWEAGKLKGKAITVIDLRQPDRFTIRTAPGRVTELENNI